MSAQPLGRAEASHEPLPLSAAQTAIASAQLSLSTSALYWTAQRLEIKPGLGNFETMAHLEQVLIQLLGACEVLHTTPELSEQGWQQRLGDKPVRLTKLAFPTAEQACDHCQAQLKQAFSLGDELYHCHIIQLPASIWVYLQVHHFAFDGYSYSLFWQAVCARLTNPQLPLPAWGIAPLVQQDQALRCSTTYLAQVRTLAERLPAPLAWSERNPLAEISAPLLLNGASLQLAEVQEAAARLNLNWPQWLACACAWVLHQLGWTHQSALGLVNMARRGPQARVPLMCMGLQALHSPAAANMEQFAALFMQELAAWQPCPQVRWEELAPSGYSHPLGACVNLLLFPQALQLDGFNLQLNTLAQGPVQQLNLNLNVEGPNLCLLAAIPNHWQPLGAERVLEALARLLVNPSSDLRLVPPNCVIGPTPSAPIDLLGRLWQQKSRTPHAPAYCDLSGNLTSYRNLYRQMVSLSEQLTASGLTTGERVALWAQPGLSSLLAFLAIGFSKASYLPIDPSSSPERLCAQLTAAGVRWLLAPESALPPLKRALAPLPELALLNLDELLCGPESATPCKAPPNWDPEQEAYVLFTSGSSGEPKGVVMNWGAYGQFLAAAQQAYQPPLAARWLKFATMSFDASLEEIGLCLSHGGCLIERPDPCDFASLNAVITRHQINVLDLPTAYWHQWIASTPPPQPSLQLTIIGGEALCAERLRDFRQLQGLGRLINSYGPTETCIVACAQEAAADADAATSDLSIGRPLPGMGALILDVQRQPLPPGCIGELHLFGPQLAEGYLDPTQTRQRFLAPAPAWQLPGLLYATKDLVRQNAHGELEFLGRNDDEIKLDGQRIDLHALTQSHLEEPYINQAALWLERRANPAQIKAALVLTPGAEFNSKTLKTRLASHWPSAALPSCYLLLEQLPLNSRGKTDWAALAKIAKADQPKAATNLTRQLQQLWQECLGTAPTPQEDFWQAGGRSLTALVLAQKISALIGTNFPAQRLYVTPGFSDLCQQVEDLAAQERSGASSGNLCLHPGAKADSNTVTIYACAPIDGGIEAYRPLGAACDLPLWGLPTTGLCNQDSSLQPFDDWVRNQCQWLQNRPGPLVLMGWSSGGSLALSLAAALSDVGRTPEGVLLLDAYPPHCWRNHPVPCRREALLNLIDVPEGFDPSSMSEQELIDWLARPEGSYPGLTASALEPLILATLNQMLSFRRWQFAPYAGAVNYLAATLTAGPVPHKEALSGAACGPIQWHSIQATHLGLLEPRHIPAIAALLTNLARPVRHV